MKLDNKTVLITGAARGLGKIYAEHCLNLGAKVRTVTILFNFCYQRNLSSASHLTRTWRKAPKSSRWAWVRLIQWVYNIKHTNSIFQMVRVNEERVTHIQVERDALYFARKSRSLSWLKKLYCTKGLYTRRTNRGWERNWNWIRKEIRWGQCSLHSVWCYRSETNRR